MSLTVLTNVIRGILYLAVIMSSFSEALGRNQVYMFIVNRALILLKAEVREEMMVAQTAASIKPCRPGGERICVGTSTSLTMPDATGLRRNFSNY